MTYTVTVDGELTLPTFITSTQLTTLPMNIIIGSSDRTHVTNSPYTVRITATATNLDTTVASGSATFKVAFKGLNYAPPGFMPAL